MPDVAWRRSTFDQRARRVWRKEDEGAEMCTDVAEQRIAGRAADSRSRGGTVWQVSVGDAV
jgi:hypothetical protein